MEDNTYDLEIQRIVDAVKEKGYRKVCLQLPDGLKQRAKEVADSITSQTPAQVLIWAGSNFGACDLPIEVRRLGVDLFVHFGHSEWVYDREKIR